MKSWLLAFFVALLGAIIVAGLIFSVVWLSENVSLWFMSGALIVVSAALVATVESNRR